jgi:hypothetical protein
MSSYVFYPGMRTGFYAVRCQAQSLSIGEKFF